MIDLMYETTSGSQVRAEPLTSQWAVQPVETRGKSAAVGGISTNRKLRGLAQLEGVMLEVENQKNRYVVSAHKYDRSLMLVTVSGLGTVPTGPP